MSVSELIPWNRNRTAVFRPANRDPFLSLQREVNRLFDNTWGGFDLALTSGNGRLDGSSWPHVDLVEHDKDFILTVEMAGMDEKDIDVQFADQCVILRGERKAMHDEKKDDLRCIERFYGQFERRIPLGVDIETDKAKAQLHNGVLTVTLPKAEQSQSAHRIPITAAA